RAQRYSSILSDACLVTYPRAYFLQDVDSHLYCTRYLRAWALERGIRRRLENDYGEDWYRRKEAGAFLAGLWSEGQGITGEQLALRTGGSIDLAGLAPDFTSER
ncbi:MAG: hypothetical protein AB1742_03575, partial [bacterium]